MISGGLEIKDWWLNLRIILSLQTAVSRSRIVLNYLAFAHSVKDIVARRCEDRNLILEWLKTKRYLLVQRERNLVL